MKLFEPSSSMLNVMIARAEAKFDAAREQAMLRAEAAEDARSARAWDAEVKARHYFRIQHGVR